MKKILVIILAGMVMVVLCGCAKITIRVNAPAEKTTAEETSSEAGSVNKGNKMNFQYFRLIESGSIAMTTVYYGEKTDTGVHLEKYYSWNNWNEESHTTEEDREMLGELDGDIELYDQVVNLFDEAKVRKWDGFTGSNPNVLDGYGFSFEAELTNGKIISASGTNKFPEGYYTFTDGMENILFP